MPLGPEFQANTDLLDNPPQPAAAVASSGLYLLVWNQSTSIAGRLYDTTGAPFSSPFFVNQDLLDGASIPDVGVDSSGNFVAVWEISNEDGNAEGVFGRRLDSLGNPIGAEFQVSTITVGSQTNPAIDVLPSGDFVVAWASYTPPSTQEIRGQRFNSSGGKIGTEFQVSATAFPLFTGNYPLDVDHASTGGFTVVWQDSDGGQSGIFGQRFDSAGAKVGAEFQSNTFTAGTQGLPAIGFDGADNSVIVWWDGNLETIFGRRYDSAGAAVGNQFQVSTHTVESASAYDPAINVAPYGAFIVTWQEIVGDGDQYGIRARRFDSLGTALGTEFLVNSVTANTQTDADVAAMPNGSFVVVWDSYHPLKGQRFLVTCGNGVVDTWEQCDPPNGMTCTSDCQIPLTASDGEFQVNTYTTDSQSRPEIGMASDGRFVVVWSSYGQTGYGSEPEPGAFAQRFESDWTPLGTEFQVASFTTSMQTVSGVGVQPNGDFVIVWTDRRLGDPVPIDAFAQRFDSGGGRLGTEFEVSDFIATYAYQTYPDIAVDSLGRFVVVWASTAQDGNFAAGNFSGITARRYASDGTPLATEFVVNSYTLRTQNDPAVAAASNGDFVVTWTSYYGMSSQDGDGKGVFGQQFASNGGKIGSEFMVNTFTIGIEYGSDVAAQANGDFLIVWMQTHSGFGSDVFGRLYSSSGAPSAPFQISTYTTESQVSPRVAAYDDGFVVTWENVPGIDMKSLDTFARRVDNAGALVGTEFLVNSYTMNGQGLAAVAATPEGNFVIVWNDYDGRDGSLYGVFGQRFLKTCGNGVVDPGEQCDPAIMAPPCSSECLLP